jgi:hypothetical protein
VSAAAQPAGALRAAPVFVRLAPLLGDKQVRQLHTEISTLVGNSIAG